MHEELNICVVVCLRFLHLNDYAGNQKKYIIIHNEEHKFRCYIIAVWQKGASVYTQLPVLGVGSKRVIKIWVRILDSN